MNNIEYYNLLSIISLVMFIILSVMAVAMWFKLDVKHYIAVLTGSEARKSIDKIKKDAASGEIQADRRRRNNRAVISWNTSEGLDGNSASAGRQQAGFDPDRTMVLGQPDPYATMVLSQLSRQEAAQGPAERPAAPAVRDDAQIPSPGDLAKPAFDFVVEKEITNSADTQQ